jgi:hypothetical protein
MLFSANLHLGPSAWIAGLNSIIGSATSHMWPKWASNGAAAAGSRMIDQIVVLGVLAACPEVG